jgi:hypothetical protein
MGFFKKKADPISERAKALNDQIAALEAEIQRLSTQRAPEEPTSTPPPSAPVRAPRPEAPPKSQPKLRSTTLPHSLAASAAHAQASEANVERRPVEEPVLEDLNPFRDPSEAMPPRAATPDLGLRDDSLSIWERVKNNFRGPATSNPKLVNYLAAGSIQGLRPLRYEKRVARNRFLLLAVALALVLWGLLAAFLKR